MKMILAGAQCVQIVSTLYNNQVTYIRTMLQEIEEWMDSKGYAKLDDFRGKLSKKNTRDPWAYERAQYVNLLFEAEKLLGTAPLP